MIEIAVKFRVDNVDQMRGEVKAFLDALREYCDADVAITTTSEGKLTEETNVGYKYDDGSPINDVLRELCKERKVDDWRKTSLTNLFEMGRPVGFNMAFARANIFTLGDLVQYSEKAVLSIRGLGSKKVEIIHEKLDELGLSLATD
ncbi:MAG: hypothetical protein K6G49_03635 [Candidatus Saccharibacteria bacterium]|nr:hypothetical protein [Candidatus Saccharibacteria bacterium]